MIHERRGDLERGLRDCWLAMRHAGLNSMGRNHIHFAPGAHFGEEDAISDRVSETEVLIILGVTKASQRVCSSSADPTTLCSSVESIALSLQPPS